MQPFPWDDMMAIGLGVLGFAPRDFWALTPRELDAALRGRFGGGDAARALTRAGFDGLLKQFPD